MHILHKQSKKPVNTPVREKLRFLLIRLSDKVRPCVEERNNVNFKEQYFDVWTAVWNLHKKYHGIRQQDEQRWQQLDRECAELHDHYKNTPQQKFVENLLLSVVSELEERSKDGQN